MSRIKVKMLWNRILYEFSTSPCSHFKWNPLLSTLNDCWRKKNADISRMSANLTTEKIKSIGRLVMKD